MVIPTLAVLDSTSAYEGHQSSTLSPITMVLEATSELVPRPALLLPICFVILSVLYSLATASDSLPTTIPWIGKDPHKLFAETRAHLSSFTKVRQWLKAGYDKVCPRARRVMVITNNK